MAKRPKRPRIPKVRKKGRPKTLKAGHKASISRGLARALGPTQGYDPYVKVGRKPGKGTASKSVTNARKVAEDRNIVRGAKGTKAAQKAIANPSKGAIARRAADASTAPAPVKNPKGTGTTKPRPKGRATDYRRTQNQGKGKGAKTPEDVLGKDRPNTDVPGGGVRAADEFLLPDDIREQKDYNNKLTDMKRRLANGEMSPRDFVERYEKARARARRNQGAETDSGYGRNRSAAREAIYLHTLGEDLGLLGKNKNNKNKSDATPADGTDGELLVADESPRPARTSRGLFVRPDDDTDELLVADESPRPARTSRGLFLRPDDDEQSRPNTSAEKPDAQKKGTGVTGLFGTEFEAEPAPERRKTLRERARELFTGKMTPQERLTSLNKQGGDIDKAIKEAQDRLVTLQKRAPGADHSRQLKRLHGLQRDKLKNQHAIKALELGDEAYDVDTKRRLKQELKADLDRQRMGHYREDVALNAEMEKARKRGRGANGDRRESMAKAMMRPDYEERYLNQDAPMPADGPRTPLEERLAREKVMGNGQRLDRTPQADVPEAGAPEPKRLDPLQETPEETASRRRKLADVTDARLQQAVDHYRNKWGDNLDNPDFSRDGDEGVELDRDRLRYQSALAEQNDRAAGMARPDTETLGEQDSRRAQLRNEDTEALENRLSAIDGGEGSVLDDVDNPDADGGRRAEAAAIRNELNDRQADQDFLDAGKTVDARTGKTTSRERNAARRNAGSQDDAEAYSEANMRRLESMSGEYDPERDAPEATERPQTGRRAPGAPQVQQAPQRPSETVEERDARRRMTSDMGDAELENIAANDGPMAAMARAELADRDTDRRQFSGGKGIDPKTGKATRRGLNNDRRTAGYQDDQEAYSEANMRNMGPTDDVDPDLDPKQAAQRRPADPDGYGDDADAYTPENLARAERTAGEYDPATDSLQTQADLDRKAPNKPTKKEQEALDRRRTADFYDEDDEDIENLIGDLESKFGKALDNPDTVWGETRQEQDEFNSAYREYHRAKDELKARDDLKDNSPFSNRRSGSVNADGKSADASDRDMARWERESEDNDEDLFDEETLEEVYASAFQEEFDHTQGDRDPGIDELERLANNGNLTDAQRAQVNEFADAKDPARDGGAFQRQVETMTARQGKKLIKDTAEKYGIDEDRLEKAAARAGNKHFYGAYHDEWHDWAAAEMENYNRSNSTDNIEVNPSNIPGNNDMAAFRRYAKSIDNGGAKVDGTGSKEGANEEGFGFYFDQLGYIPNLENYVRMKSGREPLGPTDNDSLQMHVNPLLRNGVLGRDNKGGYHMSDRAKAARRKAGTRTSGQKEAERIAKVGNAASKRAEDWSDDKLLEEVNRPSRSVDDPIKQERAKFEAMRRGLIEPDESYERFAQNRPFFQEALDKRKAQSERDAADDELYDIMGNSVSADDPKFDTRNMDRLRDDERGEQGSLAGIESAAASQANGDRAMPELDAVELANQPKKSERKPTPKPKAAPVKKAESPKPTPAKKAESPKPQPKPEAKADEPKQEAPRPEVKDNAPDIEQLAKNAREALQKPKSKRKKAASQGKPHGEVMREKDEARQAESRATLEKNIANPDIGAIQYHAELDDKRIGEMSDDKAKRELDLLTERAKRNLREAVRIGKTFSGDVYIGQQRQIDMLHDKLGIKRPKELFPGTRAQYEKHAPIGRGRANSTPDAPQVEGKGLLGKALNQSEVPEGRTPASAVTSKSTGKNEGTSKGANALIPGAKSNAPETKPDGKTLTERAGLGESPVKPAKPDAKAEKPDAKVEKAETATPKRYATKENLPEWYRDRTNINHPRIQDDSLPELNTPERDSMDNAELARHLSTPEGKAAYREAFNKLHNPSGLTDAEEKRMERTRAQAEALQSVMGELLGHEGHSVDDVIDSFEWKRVANTKDPKKVEAYLREAFDIPEVKAPEVPKPAKAAKAAKPAKEAETPKADAKQPEVSKADLDRAHKTVKTYKGMIEENGDDGPVGAAKPKDAQRIRRDLEIARANKPSGITDADLDKMENILKKGEAKYEADEKARIEAEKLDTPASKIDHNTTEFMINGKKVTVNRGTAPEWHKKLTDRNYQKRDDLKGTAPSFGKPEGENIPLKNAPDLIGLDRAVGDAGTHRDGKYIGGGEYSRLGRLKASYNRRTGKIDIELPGASKAELAEFRERIDQQLEKHGGLKDNLRKANPNEHFSGDPIDEKHLDIVPKSLNPSIYPEGKVRIDGNKVHVGDYTVTDNGNGTYTVTSDTAPLDVDMRGEKYSLDQALRSVDGQTGPTLSNIRDDNAKQIEAIDAFDKFPDEKLGDAINVAGGREKFRKAVEANYDILAKAGLPEFDEKRKKAGLARIDAAQPKMDGTSGLKSKADAPKVATTDGYKPTDDELSPSNDGLYFSKDGAWYPPSEWHADSLFHPNWNNDEYIYVPKTGGAVRITGVAKQFKNGNFDLEGVYEGGLGKWKQRFKFGDKIDVRTRFQDDRESPQQWRLKKQAQADFEEATKGLRGNDPKVRDGIVRRDIIDEKIMADRTITEMPTASDQEVRDRIVREGERLVSERNAATNTDGTLPDGKGVTESQSDVNTIRKGQDGKTYGTAKRVSLHRAGEVDSLTKTLVDDPDARIDYYGHMAKVDKVEEFGYGYKIHFKGKDGKPETVKFNREGYGNVVFLRKELTYDNGSPMSADDAKKYQESLGRQNRARPVRGNTFYGARYSDLVDAEEKAIQQELRAGGPKADASPAKGADAGPAKVADKDGKVRRAASDKLAKQLPGGWTRDTNNPDQFTNGDYTITTHSTGRYTHFQVTRKGDDRKLGFSTADHLPVVMGALARPKVADKDVTTRDGRTALHFLDFNHTGTSMSTAGRKRAREHAASLPDKALAAAYWEARDDYNNAKGNFRSAGIRNAYGDELEYRRLVRYNDNAQRTYPKGTPTMAKWGQGSERFDLQRAAKGDKDAAKRLDGLEADYANALHEYGGMDLDAAKAQAREEREDNTLDPVKRPSEGVTGLAGDKPENDKPKAWPADDNKYLTAFEFTGKIDPEHTFIRPDGTTYVAPGVRIPVTPKDNHFNYLGGEASRNVANVIDNRVLNRNPDIAKARLRDYGIEAGRYVPLDDPDWKVTLQRGGTFAKVERRFDNSRKGMIAAREAKKPSESATPTPEVSKEQAPERPSGQQAPERPSRERGAKAQEVAEREARKAQEVTTHDGATYGPVEDISKADGPQDGDADTYLKWFQDRPEMMFDNGDVALVPDKVRALKNSRFQLMGVGPDGKRKRVTLTSLDYQWVPARRRTSDAPAGAGRQSTPGQKAATRKSRGGAKPGDTLTTSHLSDGESLTERGSIKRGDHVILSTPEGFRVMEGVDGHRMDAKKYKTLTAARKRADALQGIRDTKAKAARAATAERKRTEDRDKYVDNFYESRNGEKPSRKVRELATGANESEDTRSTNDVLVTELANLNPRDAKGFEDLVEEAKRIDDPQYIEENGLVNEERYELFHDLQERLGMVPYDKDATRERIVEAQNKAASLEAGTGAAKPLSRAERAEAMSMTLNEPAPGSFGEHLADFQSADEVYAQFPDMQLMSQGQVEMLAAGSGEKAQAAKTLLRYKFGVQPN